VVRSVEDSIRR